MADWFQDESFWVDLYSYMFSPDRVQAAEDEVDQLMELIPYSGQSVLDLCCGPGRHAIALAKRGFKVTGVDGSPFLLDKAREGGDREGVDIEWVLEDMRLFVRPESFDLALSMFTSFGYFERKEDDLHVLCHLFQSLKPGGVFVMDIMSKEALASKFVQTNMERLEDGSLLIQHHEVVSDWTRVKNEWFLIQGGKAKSFQFNLTLYSGQELKDRLIQAGFEDVWLYGDLKGGDYDLAAKRLVAVARKSEQKSE